MQHDLKFVSSLNIILVIVIDGFVDSDDRVNLDDGDVYKCHLFCCVRQQYISDCFII
jgi:hypothetical protein